MKINEFDSVNLTYALTHLLIEEITPDYYPLPFFLETCACFMQFIFYYSVHLMSGCYPVKYFKKQTMMCLYIRVYGFVTFKRGNCEMV